MVQAYSLLFFWLVLIERGTALDQITIVGPKFVAATQPFNIFVGTSNLNKGIIMSATFREERQFASLMQDAESLTTITFNEGGRNFSTTKLFNFSALIKHDGQCHDLSFKVEPFIKKVFVFVQMDKAVYKPGDDVKFRVITLNDDLVPMKQNNIKVTLVNPLGAHLVTKSDLSDVNELGLFNETFTLPSNPPEGKWGLYVAVGRANTTKYFTVQNYTLPFYELKVHTRPKVGLDEKDLKVDVEAIYSFGGHVAGEANVTISSPNFDATFIKVAPVENIKTFTFSIEQEFQIRTLPDKIMHLNVSVSFTDHMTLKTVVKSMIVTLYPERTCKIQLLNANDYRENADFSFDIMVEDFDGNVIESDTAPVKVKFANSAVNCQNNVISEKNIEESIASFKIRKHISCGGTNILDVEFKNCKLSVNIDNEREDLRKLVLRVSSVRPKLGTNITLNAYSRGKIVNGFWVAINRYGMIDKGSKKCGSRGCERIKFKVPVLKQSLPKVTIFVFALVKTESTGIILAQGKIDVTFDDLSDNYVSMEVPKDSIKPRTTFEMVLKSKEQAQVSLLAIDKSVTILATGNDLEINDFVLSYSNYGSDVHALEYRFTDARVCTEEDEILLIPIKSEDSGVQTAGVKDKTLTRIANMDEDENSKDQKEGRVTFIRSNFPETWLYETVLMGNDATKALSITVPDTITTWIFTAFSLHSSGIALAAPQQLVVKQDYFVKMNLPYAGRVDEILTVDAIVFNFIGDKKDVKTTVSFSVDGAGEKYEMIERISNNQNCQSRNSNKKLNVKEITAKYGQGTKVSFHFLPKVTGKIDLTLGIETADKKYTDAIKKSIEIVNIGVREFEHHKFVSKFENSATFSAPTVFEACVSMSVGVTGDKVSNAFTYYRELVDLPNGCGEQTTSSFNHNLLIYLYQRQTKSLSFALSRSALPELQSDYTRVTTFTYPSGGVALSHGGRIYPCVTALATTVIGRAMHEGVVEKNVTFIKNNLDYLTRGDAVHDHYYCKGPSYNDDIPVEKKSKKVHEKSYILLAFLKNKAFIPNFESLYSSFVTRELKTISILATFVDAHANAMYAYALAWKGTVESIDKSKELLGQITNTNSKLNGDERYYFVNKTGSMASNDIKILVTSYVALTYIKLNMAKEVEPIISWLSKNTRPGTSYSEPYYSAVAIEALTEAAKVLTNAESNYTLEINTEDSTNTWQVDKSNMHEYKYKEISRGGHVLNLTASGHGFMSVDAACEKYRTTAKSSDILDLTVTTEGVSQSNKIGSLDICIKCTSENCSDMVILEVQLQSGFIYVESLNEFFTVPHVKGVEIDKGSTIFKVYIHEMSPNQRACSKFNVQQKSSGDNLKDGYVKAFVYNSYDKYTSKAFNLVTKLCTYTNEFAPLDWVDSLA